jgi:hypothetical protein
LGDPRRERAAARNGRMPARSCRARFKHNPRVSAHLKDYALQLVLALCITCCSGWRPEPEHEGAVMRQASGGGRHVVRCAHRLCRVRVDAERL